MELGKLVTKAMVLAYFLFMSAWLVSDFKYWENELLFLYSQFVIGIHKGIGYRFPITGKTIAIRSHMILQAAGTLGALAVFFIIYGSKKAAKALFLVCIIITILHSIPVDDIKHKDINGEIINVFKFIAVNAGLLSFC